MSWWWGLGGLALVLAAVAVAACARRLEVERGRLATVVARLGPLRAEADRLGDDLARIGAAASARRRRLQVRSPGSAPGGAESDASGHR